LDESPVKLDFKSQTLELVKFLRKADNRHYQREDQRRCPRYLGQDSVRSRANWAVFSHDAQTVIGLVLT
jgi:hypothetical protein